MISKVNENQNCAVIIISSYCKQRVLSCICKGLRLQLVIRQVDCMCDADNVEPTVA